MYMYFTPGVSQDVAIGSSSAQSAAFTSTIVTHVKLTATSACYVAMGANPTASKGGSNSMRLAPNFPEIYRVAPGWKIAVIEDSAAGTLSITELTR